MLKQRVLTAAFLIAVIIGALLAGKWAVLLLLAICSAGGAFEYSRLVTSQKGLIKNLPLIICCLTTIFVAVYYPDYLLHTAVAFFLVLFMISLVTPAADGAKSALIVWGYIYTGLFLALAARILLSENGYLILITSIVACSLCDTAAYFIGRKFGKKKLCPTISPNKTVAGAVAGFFAAFITFAAGFFFCKNIPMANKLPFFLFGGIIVGIVGQFGDLAASVVKRKFNVKDYGDIFPGHGGFLDRIDSYLFVFAAMYIFADLVIKL